MISFYTFDKGEDDISKHRSDAFLFNLSNSRFLLVLQVKFKNEKKNFKRI